ncbi:unnamed protein product [Rotaria sp. Silwood1]|nr:unnamed protein product [Rotaria sp. Silwood1]CAF1180291.1 unnamed protein product [Rotaria sp. Silwood1]
MNTIAEKSLSVSILFVERFVKVGNSLKEVHQIFKCLLRYCYELHQIADNNKELNEDIDNKICHQKQNFDDIRKCIEILYAKQKLDPIFVSFDDCIKNNDERTVHYIGAYLRQTMMNRVDDYMKSLALFRHKFLLNSIRETIKNKTADNILATQALSYLVIEFLASKNNTIPLVVINSLHIQLDNTTHSHFVYVQTKIDDLTKMRLRFSNVEKVLPEFSELFGQLLNDKYDHLSEQDAFFSFNDQIRK